jgi:hypothetical protein
MFNDLLNLKIYDAKIHWKESVAELYKVLIEDYEKTIKSRKELSVWFESRADIDHDEVSDKLAIEKIIEYWSIFFIYVSRVNFLKNVLSQNQSAGIFKGKEIKEFNKTADSYIQDQLESFVMYMQPQLFYFFIGFFDIRHETSLSDKIKTLYLNALSSSTKGVDKVMSNSASKISQLYALENLVTAKCEHQLQIYMSQSDE